MLLHETKDKKERKQVQNPDDLLLCMLLLTENEQIGVMCANEKRSGSRFIYIRMYVGWVSADDL